WSIGVTIEKARIRRALPAADLGIAAGHRFVISADRFHDRVAPRNLRCLGVIADEPHLGRVLLHPGILGRGARHLLDQAALDALVVLAGHRADAALEQAVHRKRARIIPGREAADDAGKRIERVGIERMRDGRYALGLEVGDRFDDLVAELDSADALVALLNARRLAVNLDLEPDAADACRLDR